MKRRLIIILIIAICVLSPLVILGIQNIKNVRTIPFDLLKMKLRPKTVAQYSTLSKIPNVTLTLKNTQYLEYVAANLKLFSDQAIVDPEQYYGKKIGSKKYTITQLRFELVPTLDRYMVGISGEKGFAAFGTYAIEDNTLVVRVSVDLSETGNPLAGPLNQHEDVFLRAALLTLYYAHGRTDGMVDPIAFRKIQEEIKTYIYDGVFVWPVQITQQ